jgi:hypothetical protein
MKLKTGQYVRHSRYGWGTILEDDGKRTSVYFRSVGIKKLVASRDMFVVVGGQAPNKKTVGSAAP